MYNVKYEKYVESLLVDIEGGELVVIKNVIVYFFIWIFNNLLKFYELEIYCKIERKRRSLFILLIIEWLYFYE